MIKDYIKEKSNISPKDIFIIINKKEITYHDFDKHVYSIEQFVLSKKKSLNCIKVNCLDKFNLLASIIACNRLNVRPAVFPPKNNLIKFADYDKLIKADMEINDLSCMMQPIGRDCRESIFYNETDIQCVLFTSGTEKAPKAVQLTFSNIYNSAVNWDNVVRFDSDDNYLNILPLWHIAGLSIFFRSIYFNFKSIIYNYDKNQIHILIKKYKINCISIVPKMIRDLNMQNDELKNFKIVIVGGDKISINDYNFFNKNQINAYISYGMTETSSGIAGYFINKINDYIDGYIGTPHQNTIIKIVNSGIVVESNTIMDSYYGMKKCNGKFKTRDLGYVENDKLFYKSRSGNFIVSGGENINLKLIKNVIHAYNKKIIVKIGGMKDSKWGEVPVVVIDKKKFNISEIRNHCKLFLPKHMCPKYFYDISEIKKYKIYKIL